MYMSYRHGVIRNLTVWPEGIFFHGVYSAISSTQPHYTLMLIAFVFPKSRTVNLAIPVHMFAGILSNDT
jgi:hypothetical protein